MPCVYLFIEKNKNSDLKELSRFASGLEKNLYAIEKAVESPLSNGFGKDRNKIKNDKTYHEWSLWQGFVGRKAYIHAEGLIRIIVEEPWRQEYSSHTCK